MSVRNGFCTLELVSDDAAKSHRPDGVFGSLLPSALLRTRTRQLTLNEAKHPPG
jgi:hypothetical protein